jgi:tryptophan-rich sensory protein
MARAILYSLVICALGAALEGLFAGKGIKHRLASLRLPSYAVPFWGWMVIGGLYYVICFSILYRLFLLSPSSSRTAAFALICAFMFLNALWNYFFFRTRNLFHAYVLGLPYSVVAISLFLLLLLRLDGVAAWCLLPYLLYLFFYANLWGYRIWKLNSDERTG